MSTFVKKGAVALWVLCALSGQAQTARSLKDARKIYVGSLGTADGALALQTEVVRYIKRSKEFALVSTPAAADAVLEGKGEIWIRGYHSLSPRARKNSTYADPIETGYLSVRLRGADDEILWSYFADPRRVTIHDIKRDLVDETTDRLILDHQQETAPATPVSNAQDQPAQLNGGGATFPFPIYREWITGFQKRHPAWKFSYAPQGSQKGWDELLSGHLDFAGTDIPPAYWGAKARQFGFFPTVAGAVVLIYNLPGFSGQLRLTGEVLAGILSGSITRWDDEALRKLNPSAPLPGAPVRVLHREDGSGTTYALTDYLSNVSADWKQHVGASPHPAWKVGEHLNGSENLAQAVSSTPNSFGYVEFIYAYTHHLPVASVQNRAGQFIAPGLLSIMAAANWAGDRPQDLNQSIVNSPYRAAYPISNLTWLVVPQNLIAEKKLALQAFLNWALESGQRQCSGLGYAPLPRNLVDQEINLLRRLP